MLAQRTALQQQFLMMQGQHHDNINLAYGGDTSQIISQQQRALMQSQNAQTAGDVLTGQLAQQQRMIEAQDRFRWRQQHQQQQPQQAREQQPLSQSSCAPSSVPGSIHNLSANSYASSRNVPQATPEFPGHFTSMESNILNEGEPQRSALAAAGTYMCMFHECTQRFETGQNLDRHVVEEHIYGHEVQQQRA